MTPEELQLPFAFTIAAIFFFALSGALSARRLGYDFVGVFALAFATGLGGGLIRDSLLRGSGPVVALTDARYMGAVAGATLCGSFRVAARIENFNRLVAGIDAIGLAAFAVSGTNMGLRMELHWAAAVFVGVVSAVGGGLLRDVLIRTEPLLLKPGQFYALAALFGASLYAGLIIGFELKGLPAAISAIIATVAFRVLAIVFNWKTRPVESAEKSSPGMNLPVTGRSTQNDIERQAPTQSTNEPT